MQAIGGDRALASRRTGSDAVRGWIAERRLGARGASHQRSIRGVNVDEAFRNAMRGAAQVFSGNSQPK